jgi:Fe-S cluster assembly scaffold protein SufB
LDRESAEGLIVEGFFQSVLRKLDMPAAEEKIWAAIGELRTVSESAAE